MPDNVLKMLKFERLGNMDIKKQLLNNRSKEHTRLIVDYINNQQERFDELVNHFLSNDELLVQRAAWVLGDSGRMYPSLVIKHLPALIANLRRGGHHDAVKRNTIRILEEMEIPEKFWGEVADICFKYLSSNQEPVAIKCFSMTTLLNIVKHIPELKEELQVLIEDQMPYSSAGFQSRGKKTLIALSKI